MRGGEGEHRGAAGRWVPRAKVTSPGLPADFVRRKELRERLASAVDAAGVTLVCAPAGYGKTLLLADWLAGPGRDARAWVSLDRDDDSAEAFLAAVLSAVRAHVPVPVTTAPPPGDTAAAVAVLVDAVAAAPGRLVLVLDNVHAVPGARHVLTALIRHQPHNLRLVLASRSDPPLPLARLRVQGRLAELRADALRFRRPEARELLERCGVTLPDGPLARLVTHTEGWAAGLRLAARSLRGGTDPEDFLPRCAGHDHAVADFLTGEVLAHLPDDTRDVLTRLSVCETVSPPLAARLTGRADAGAVLAALEGDGLLSSTVDGEYRPHPMLRAYLRADLAHRRPELASALHHEAAAWFAAQDRPRDALHHAEQTGDGCAAVTLLADRGAGMLLDGQPGLVLRALAAAGPAVAGDALLLLFSALAHLELGDLGAAEAEIARSGRVWPGRADERLTAFRRLVVSAHALACGRPPVRGPAGACSSPAAEAWERLDHGLVSLSAGDHDAASRALDAAERLSGEQDLPYLLVHVTAAHALLAAVTGDHAGMVKAAEEALALAGDGAWKHSPWLAMCHAVAGFVRLMRADPRGARASAAELGGSEAPVFRWAAGAVDAVARFDLGDRETGLRLLRNARASSADAPVPRELAAAVMVLEHECALDLARLPLARDVAEWGARRLGTTAEVHLTLARTRFARGDLESTEHAVCVARGLPPLVPGTDVELCLVAAAVALRLGRRTKAREELDRALGLAAPGRIVRPFGHVEAEVRKLLLDQVGGFGETFAARVRDVLTAGGTGTAAALTGRERAVLVRLTAPRPLDEVASELRVSLNTVKTHVRAIYAKLGVNNRRAAVAAARELGLG
ncbi:LuxR C-terminal-related transcriptional regulator [Amycolatopsis thermophila]|uniref:LuxR family maltose regulon positive regulatory protein n=1 Tax=Amycolatopsis thermophila TaxID=206084 RepID=A0ABU0F0D3_9PSEU|nr:LuxR C-terminal-related transcriptional regulator [Amycolatopsis thermophila]MDQ0380968.1 LuxR family maltose regulon positive regulatory protein [Amycolatopsis thermophila]